MDTLFGYPGACTIDISDELYKQGDIKVFYQDMSRHLFTRPMPMQDPLEKSASVW